MPDEKEKTHLSAHRTVDGDDDKTLDGVKDGKEDLEEMGKHLFVNHWFQSTGSKTLNNKAPHRLRNTPLQTLRSVNPKDTSAF